MPDQVFMIVFLINGKNYLLMTEAFLGNRFRFTPACFATLEDANALFDDLRRVIHTAESPLDPEYQRQTKKLMFLHPVIHKLEKISDEELESYFLGDLGGFCIQNTEVLNAPYSLGEMSAEFSRFAVLDVAFDICNHTTIDKDGKLNFHFTRLFAKDPSSSDNNTPLN